MEKLVISKLKNYLPLDFTRKLEGMFQDLATSSDLMREFKSQSKVKFSVTVIQQNRWSTFTLQKSIFPSDYQDTLDAFEKFYKNKFSGRKLQWVHSVGVSEVHYGKCVLKILPLYMPIILCFNRKTSWTIAELLGETNVNQEFLVKFIQNLCKKNLLKTNSTSEKLATSDLVSLNPKFGSTKAQTIRFIPHKRNLSSSANVKETRESVESERKFSIEAALVRIMKKNKTMNRQALINQCIELLSSGRIKKFIPDTRTVSARIDDLIEREFLSSKDHVIEYVA